MSDHLALLVDDTWREYARPRFTPGEKREAQARASFDAITEMLWHELRRRAKRAGHALDFSLDSLRLSILKALEQSCDACGHAFGLETWAVTFRQSPELGGTNPYLFSNLVVYCSRCALARDLLTERAWIDVLAAIRRDPEWIVEDYIDTHIVGAMVKAHGRGDARVLPGPAWAQVTREAQRNASNSRKK